METMKYTGTTNSMSGGNQDSEVESLLLTSCWAQSAGAGLQSSDFMDSHKLLLDGSMGSLSDGLGGGGPGTGSDDGSDMSMATKATMDALDSLLLNSQPLATSLAELKPLPPFIGYTGHLSINGIQGHHYHAIARAVPEENNNNTYGTTNGQGYNTDQNIVSSSTCVSADSAQETDCDGKPLFVSVEEAVRVKLEAYGDCANPDSVSSAAAKLYDGGGGGTADSVTHHVKTEMGEYDISSIDDIAAIIGSAIADTTVPNNSMADCGPGEDPGSSRDNWMELDAWIDGACVDGSTQKSLIITQDGLSEFIMPASPHTNQPMDYPASTKLQQAQQHQQQQQQSQGSTLQSLLTHGYMPLLQNRLQNGPPVVKQEAPSSTSYGVEIISTSSPPANVVSTTDSIMLNGRYIQHYGVMGGMTDDRIRSPDLLGQNYPHTTTTTPTAPKKSRNRAQKKHQQQQQQQAASSTVFQAEQNLGLLGKEKPVHRCNICNRGFLNKSNIKVHLRTHTGEKPFRCETCAKAFRQKAHLIKHQQIHKRIGRD